MFFALWPQAQTQAALAQNGRELQRGVGGKLTRQESIHLTLAFLGNVPEQRIDEVRRIGTDAQFEPFTLSVDTPGCWGHNGIAWLGSRVIPEPLLALVGSLRGALSRAGFRVEPRAYAAHVTVVRKARCRPVDLMLAPVEWRVDDFVLVRSELNAEGSRYSVVGRWPNSTRKPD
jgi:RNA 2',3'-cyclic 3'-phosphodiesterase